MSKYYSPEILLVLNTRDYREETFYLRHSRAILEICTCRNKFVFVMSKQ